MNTKLNQCNISNIDLSEVGNRWQVKGDRLYLSDDFKLKALGLEVQYYKTGSVSGATQDGEPISNSQATRLIEGCRRAWVDLETGELRDCFFIKYDSRDRGTLKMITPGARWDETTISDEDQPGVRFCPVHRPGTGHDSEAEVKAFFEGRLFYWHRNELIYSFTR